MIILDLYVNCQVQQRGALAQKNYFKIEVREAEEFRNFSQTALSSEKKVLF